MALFGSPIRTPSGIDMVFGPLCRPLNTVVSDPIVRLARRCTGEKSRSCTTRTRSTFRFCRFSRAPHFLPMPVELLPLLPDKVLAAEGAFRNGWRRAEPTHVALHLP